MKTPEEIGKEILEKQLSYRGNDSQGFLIQLIAQAICDAKTHTRMLRHNEILAAERKRTDKTIAMLKNFSGKDGYEKVNELLKELGVKV